MALLANEIVGLDAAISAVKREVDDRCHELLIENLNNLCDICNNEKDVLARELNVTVLNPDIKNRFYDYKHADEYESHLIPNLPNAIHFVVVMGDDKFSGEIRGEFYNQNMTITDKVQYVLEQMCEMIISNSKRFAGYSD